MFFFKKLRERWLAKKKRKVSRINVQPQQTAVATKLTTISKNTTWSEWEKKLISADLSTNFVIDIINVAQKKLKSTENIVVVPYLMKELSKKYYQPNTSSQWNLASDKINVILLTGVNGVGKTTSAAKIAAYYQKKKPNLKIMLIAADTFRAGATEQLQSWGNTLNITVQSGKFKQSPASVVYQGIQKALAENYQLIVIDTAGRLHNKQYLMEELKKIYHVIFKLVSEPVLATWLVLDAQTGQNALAQANAFKTILPINGLLVTKTDSTALAGSILMINRKLKLPVVWLGTGEQVVDLKLFHLEEYLKKLLGVDSLQNNPD